MFSESPRNSDDQAQRKHNPRITGGFPGTSVAATAASPVTSPLSVSKFLPGPRYIAIYMLALPVIVVAFSSSGVEQAISGLIALTWLVLSPLALFSRKAAMFLPIASAGFLAAAVLLLSFNSAAFVVDVTATVVMFLVSVPRQWPQAQVASASASASVGRV